MNEENEIYVILVDDNQNWAQFFASALEQADDRLSVDYATSASEAQLLLNQADTTVDCVVCDYQMPEVTGLEFLRTIRETRPELPFILVTGEGDEKLASEAITAGVSDYLVKDLTISQQSILAARIRRVVENRKLRQTVAESEDQYRTLVEQSQDGIYILQDNQFQFVNQQLLTLTGHSEKELLTLDPVSDIVHPNYQEEFEKITNLQLKGVEPTQSIYEIEIVTAENDTRFCEISSDSISYRENRAILGYIRDISDRKQRERQIQRERDFNQSIRDILVRSSDTDDIAKAFCEQLVTHDEFRFAWVGRKTRAETIEPDAWAGDGEEYMNTVFLSPTAEHDSQSTMEPEPSNWALRTGEPQFIENIEEFVRASWQTEALQQGFRALASLPLESQGISYGILTVYAETPTPFDEELRQRLENLSEALAHALEMENKETALTSTQTVEVTLQSSDRDYYLFDIASDSAFRTSDMKFTVHDSIPRANDPTIEFVVLEGDGSAAVLESLQDHDDIRSASITSSQSDRTVFRISVTGPTIGSLVADLGAKLHRIIVQHGMGEIVFRVPVGRDIRSLVSEIDSTFSIKSMASITESDHENGLAATSFESTDNLTDKQREALRVAYQSGYFNNPRDSSADEIAETLDIAHSTFLQHLRAAQAKVFASRFDT